MPQAQGGNAGPAARATPSSAPERAGRVEHRLPETLTGAASTVRMSPPLWHNARFVLGSTVTASRHDILSYIEPQRGWLAHPFRAPRTLRSWLSDRGSLTRRLKMRHADFRVSPVARGFAPPFLDEAQALRLSPKTLAYVRDVLLIGGGRMRVFAHSVLPRTSLRGRLERNHPTGNEAPGRDSVCRSTHPPTRPDDASTSTRATRSITRPGATPDSPGIICGHAARCSASMGTHFW